MRSFPLLFYFHGWDGNSGIEPEPARRHTGVAFSTMIFIPTNMINWDAIALEHSLLSSTTHTFTRILPHLGESEVVPPPPLPLTLCVDVV